MSGNLSEMTENGIARFNDLRILSSGYFYIVATALNSTIGYSHIIGITNFIKSVEFIPPAMKYYIYDHAAFTIKVNGDDDQAYLRNFNYSLTSPFMHSSYNHNPTTNLISYEITPYCLGNTYIQMEIRDFKSFSVNNSMVISGNPFAQIRVYYYENSKNYAYPALSNDIFGGNYDNEYIEVLLLVRNEYYSLNRIRCFDFTVKSVCVSKFCSGEEIKYSNLGNSLYNSKNGNSAFIYAKQFFNVIIKSTGDFELLFSLPGANSAKVISENKIKTFNITNFIKNIFVQKVYSKAYINENFPVSFMIIGDDNLLYIKKHNLIIRSNCFSKDKIIENVEGFIQTELIFNQIGLCTVFIKSTHSQLLNISVSVLVDVNTTERFQYLDLSALVIVI